VDFDASCSTGNIVSYTWRFSDNPPFEETITLPTTAYDWSDNPSCGTPFSRLVRLTVTDTVGATATTQANINPTLPAGLETMEQTADSLHTSFTSRLMPPISSGRIQIQVVSNGHQMDVTDNAMPHRHDLNGRVGTNTVEAILTSAPPIPIAWELDFSGSDHFVPGSLRIEAGQVMMQAGHSITFRLTGTPGERIKLTFRLQ
jgi:hypothetical protein